MRLRRELRNQTTYLLVVPLLVTLACDAGNVGGGGPGGPGPGAGQPDSGSTVPTPGAEICDGYDNDQDGQIDEGCPCKPGASAACYPGLPGLAGVGACRQGVMQCLGNDEFSTWGACAGAVTPQPEVCGNGIDEDCDGADQPCDAPLAADGGAAGTDHGTGTVGGPGVKLPLDAGAPPPPPPPPPPPAAVKLPLFLIGDCVTASCPASEPHPVGCQVIFPPNNEPRGCVANAAGSPTVFFKAGVSCKKGLVTGFLLCSKTAGPPLGPLNCPIVGKTQWFYPSSSSGCPQ